MFPESSTGRWALLQLLCCPSKQGELSEHILQHLFHNLTPQTVDVEPQCTGELMTPIINIPVVRPAGCQVEMQEFGQL